MNMTNKFRWTKSAMQKEVNESLNGYLAHSERLAKDLIQLIADKMSGAVTELPEGNIIKITANAREGVFGAKVRINHRRGWYRLEVIDFYGC